MAGKLTRRCTLFDSYRECDYVTILKGIDIAWHWDSDGAIVIDHSNLSPEKTLAVMELAAPVWIGEVIKERLDS